MNHGFIAQQRTQQTVHMVSNLIRMSLWVSQVIEINANGGNSFKLIEHSPRLPSTNSHVYMEYNNILYNI